jgi:hypothetical protein
MVEIRAWFEEYLRAFGAVGRGESDDLHMLMQYYGVPLLLTTDEAALALTTEDEVVNAAGQQIEGCARRTRPQRDAQLRNGRAQRDERNRHG